MADPEKDASEHPVSETSSTRLSKVVPDETHENGEHEQQPKSETALPTDRAGEEAGTSISETDYLSGFRLYSVAASLVFAVFLSMLETAIVATAIPTITNYFGTIADVGWYGSAYNLTNCVLQPLAGRVYKHQSLKWSFICFIAVFQFGNLICGLAVTSKMLVVGRAIAGMGGAGISNGALVIVAHAAPLEKRPVLVSLIANVARVGSICGPVVGGAIAQKLSWRWVFLINCPAGVVSAGIILMMRLPNGQAKEDIKKDWKKFLIALDLRGFALFAPACIMLLLALQWGGDTFAWNSATIIGLFCGAAATAAVFFAWESHMKENALIPFSVLGVRAVWSGAILLLLQFGCLLSLSYWLPIYFQTSKDASPVNSGLMTLPSVLSQIIVGLTVSWGMQKTGYFTPFALVGCVVTAIGAGLMTTFQPWTGANLWIGYQILTGSGRGLAGQVAMVGVQYALPRSQVSLGTSVLTLSGNLGAAVFLAAGQTLFTNMLYPALSLYAPDVNPQTVINTGSTSIQQAADPAEQFKLVLAYNYAVTKVFYLGCAASAASLFFCFGLGFGNIKQKREEEKALRESSRQNV